MLLWLVILLIVVAVCGATAIMMRFAVGVWPWESLWDLDINGKRRKK